MMFDMKVTDDEADKLIIIDNEKPKRKYQSNDVIENIKSQGNRGFETQLESITILLFPSEQLSEQGYQNFKGNLFCTLSIILT